ncbi:MAG: glycine zipper 2TM domain-containing protein [Gammaproteobacteria bacterium]|nr:glycine zipper 2TM domain-containing protein [Gammaproteobacteria bacterium]
MTAGRRYGRGLVILALGTTVAACASTPVARTVAAPAPRPPPTQVYYYPLHEQGAAQQDRDRYECYLWAKKQTGFDPSAPQLAPHQRLEVVPDAAPGHDTAVGAVTGALLGSMVAGPHDAGGGAVAGAVAGAMIGASSDTARAEEARGLQSRLDHQTAERQAAVEREASEYRRAMTACLEGRGYSVR